MKPMTYQDALDYLYSFLDSESKLPRTPAEYNLPRTVALLERLGQPQRAFRSVVVAGTKGKGSTAALIEGIARAAGLRTGLWTSPHLHSYRERIQIDRQLISQGELARAVESLKLKIEAFDANPYGKISTFQAGFALAMRYFAEQAVDLAILEVGLGGRHDCANVVMPLLSVISSISYDHMHVLGDTLTRIAYEKAGILKPGVPGITIPQQPEAMAEIERVAAEVGAPLWVAADLPVVSCPSSVATDDGQLTTDNLNWFDPFERYHGPTATALRGVFQRENARLATGAALLLRDAGLPIPDTAIARGLATTEWLGRMEIVEGAPPIVLDGAHNGDSAHKLVESLDAAFPGRRLVLVLGTTRDKDITRILAELVPRAGALVLTRSQHPRAERDLEELAAHAEPLIRRRLAVPILLTPDIPEALDRARTLAGPEDLICVTGSLFVVAAAREALGLENEKD